MIDDDQLLDLLPKERLGQLSATEQQQLESALLVSPNLRLAAQAHRSFEELGAYEPRDDERCEDIARAVRTRLGWGAGRRGSPSTQRRARAAVLALVFTAGAAAASVATWKVATREARPAAPRPQGVPRAAVPARAPLSDVPSASGAPQQTSGAPEQTSGAPEQSDLVDKADHPPALEAAAPKVSAERLFEQATELKAAGKWLAAQALYERLLREHPGSKYAPSCVMTLGKRALAVGEAERALSSFRRYQALGGPLMAEAMWGEAEALGRLGREQQRAKVLAMLNKRFPLSPYALEKSAP